MWWQTSGYRALYKFIGWERADSVDGHWETLVRTHITRTWYRANQTGSIEAERSNWVMWRSLTCKWDAASRYTWASYSTAAIISKVFVPRARRRRSGKAKADRGGDKKRKQATWEQRHLHVQSDEAGSSRHWNQQQGDKHHEQLCERHFRAHL